MPNLLDPSNGMDNLLAPLMRNLPYTNTQNFFSNLTPYQEVMFQQWANKNKQRLGNKDFSQQVIDPTYDYRGWFLDNLGKDAPSGHFTDKFKTPFHPSFSNESQYATPNAPSWVKGNNGWSLIDQSGNTVFSE